MLIVGRLYLQPAFQLRHPTATTNCHKLTLDRDCNMIDWGRWSAINRPAYIEIGQTYKDKTIISAHDNLITVHWFHSACSQGFSSSGLCYFITPTIIISIKKIEEVSRDGRIKKYMNKSCRDDNKQNAPYILFSSNRVSMKEYVGMHFVCYHPYNSCSCTFWSYHPYLLLQFF